MALEQLVPTKQKNAATRTKTPTAKPTVASEAKHIPKDSGAAATQKQQRGNGATIPTHLPQARSISTARSPSKSLSSREPHPVLDSWTNYADTPCLWIDIPYDT